MMFNRTLPLLTLLLLLLQSPTILAHAGGHGPVSEEQAKAIAADAAYQFADFDPGLGFGKLAVSWKSLGPEAVQVHVKGDGYYVVRIENKAEEKNLYILMSETGSVFDANFTGEFPKLK